jgi:hypothetical protein
MTKQDNLQLQRLLKILLSNCEASNFMTSTLRNNLVPTGICVILSNLEKECKITLEEKWILKVHLKENRPTNLVKMSTVYWWELTTEGNQRRISFLQTLINKLD